LQGQHVNISMRMFLTTLASSISSALSQPPYSILSRYYNRGGLLCLDSCLKVWSKLRLRVQALVLRIWGVPVLVYKSTRAKWLSTTNYRFLPLYSLSNRTYFIRSTPLHDFRHFFFYLFWFFSGLF